MKYPFFYTVFFVSEVYYNRLEVIPIVFSKWSHLGEDKFSRTRRLIEQWLAIGIEKTQLLGMQTTLNEHLFNTIAIIKNGLITSS